MCDSIKLLWSEETTPIIFEEQAALGRQGSKGNHRQGFCRSGHIWVSEKEADGNWTNYEYFQSPSEKYPSSYHFEVLQDNRTSKAGTRTGNEEGSNPISLVHARRDYSGPSTVACQGGPDPWQARSKLAYTLLPSRWKSWVKKKKVFKKTTEELNSEFGTHSWLTHHTSSCSLSIEDQK